MPEILSFLKRILVGKTDIVTPIMNKISKILDAIVPKNDYLIILGSNAGNSVTGSPKSIFDAIRKRNGQFQAVFLTREPKSNGEVNVNSLKALWLFCRAKYLVSSHGLKDFGYLRHSKRSKLVCTWHGISLKGSGYMQNNLSSKMKKDLQEYESSSSICISSSVYDAAILSLMFGYPSEKIRITGRPRNDILICNQEKSGALKNYLKGLEGDERTILYAPTFRDKEFGVKNRRVRIFPFQDFSDSKLKAWLERRNMILLLRMHINDTVTELQVDNQRVFEFGNDVCEDINKVLSDVDVLVSDYSSIVYDFLLLDRPMIFIPYDLEMYQRIRGLIVDNYDFWTPGPKVKSFSEFIEYISECLDEANDPYARRRRELRNVIHSHQTPDSTSIILKHLICL